MCLCKPEIRTPWCDDCQSFADWRIKELEKQIHQMKNLSHACFDRYCENDYIKSIHKNIVIAIYNEKDQRIKELDDKLSKCQEIAMGLGIKYNEQQDKLRIAVSALKRVDNILYDHNATEMSNLIYDALEKIGG